MAYSPSGDFTLSDTNYIPNGTFVFGIVGDPEGDILAQLDDVTSIFFARNTLNSGVIQSIILDDCAASMIGIYDPNINRSFLTVETKTSNTDASKLLSDAIYFSFESAYYLDSNIYSTTDKADWITVELLFNIDNGEFLSNPICSANGDAIYIDSVTCFQTEGGTFMDQQLCSYNDQSIFITVLLCAEQEQMTKVYPDKYEIIYEDTFKQEDFLHSIMLEPFAPYNYSPSGNFNFDSINYVPELNFNFNFGRKSALQIRHTFGVLTTAVNSSLTYGDFTDIKNCIVVEAAEYPALGKTPWVDLPRPPIDPIAPGGITIEVPIKETYRMQNIITVTLDDLTTEIDLDKISLSIDADSNAWSFSATLLDLNQVGLVKQLPDGTAKKLIITINSYVWHVLVEKIAINRVYGDQSIKVSGRGLTGLLSKPYVQQSSVNQGTDLAIDQLVDLMLPVDWNALGDLYWLLGDDPIGSPVTWIVDGGAFSYVNKTPIEAISDLAKDIGVMLVPSRDSNEIYFKSRYPVLPWIFDTKAVDIAIPDSAILELTEEPVSSFQANGVYVHGSEIGGELGFIRLNGTAGDRLAPTVSNAVMTDVIGLRALGERILAGQYEQPKIKSIKTFMDGTIIPLIEIGDFVGFTVDGVEFKGIANASVITATHGEVYQSVSTGEVTPNVWVSFTEILPKDPMLVGTLSSTDLVTSLITLIDGGVVRVRGTGNVGAKYYIRSGEIVSEAPNLPYSEIVL